ncbi:AFG1/ZapE family ATPase [Limisalsivibrio acetivorans]|uniref:AFG1/ZapE family ATPase n=1 Tax=Limisalsivibrio acetivorans TaxID=1304888 RepID=UPI0003B5BF44|nr:AFG1/ZapE family ATPase [Limisalsivibrio acetivorans]
MSNKDRYINLEDISFDISIEDCFNNLRPHPKFSGCTFENYIPDDNYPSQHYIKTLLHETVEKMGTKEATPEKKRFSFFKPKKSGFEKPLNIYIDGSYGIGKTHLLSAAYNMADMKKSFMSFSEMNYFFHYLGVEKCIEFFSDLDLLLIDEFELDDPAMCLIMARFFREINKDTLVITTSNTLPTELGKTRFQVERFEKEMGVIAESFKTVVVEGEDYRKRKKKTTWKIGFADEPFLDAFNDCKTEEKAKTRIGFDKLMKILEGAHPFKFFVIPSQCEAIFIDGLKTFDQLNSALRFNHLIDHCYYYNTKLFIRSDCELSELFTKEQIESPFEKKLLRCLSRLDELALWFK